MRDMVLLLRRLSCFGGRPVAAKEEDDLRQAGDLLPGLPDSLVLQLILPRIPWYARPRLKATSRAWSDALKALSPSDLCRARAACQTYRAYRGIDTSDGDLIQVRRVNKLVNKCTYIVSLYDPEQQLWRKLPPIPCGSLSFKPHIFAGFLQHRKVRHHIQVAFVCGKVIASTLFNSPPRNSTSCDVCLWMLDIEGGMWKWTEHHRICSKLYNLDVRANMMCQGGKLYILRYEFVNADMPICYNVATGKWEKLEAAPWGTFFFLNQDHDSVTGMYTKQVIGMYLEQMYSKFCVTRSILDPHTGRWKISHESL
ncbi:hypothetical protein L7F22_036974 [Adiantum nelumboides]|nr:hypothetical protein [Adiantum nelumboides]